MQQILMEMCRTLGRIEARQEHLDDWVKRALTWLLPLLTLWGTGSIDAALKVFEAMR